MTTNKITDRPAISLTIPAAAEILKISVPELEKIFQAVATENKFWQTNTERGIFKIARSGSLPGAISLFTSPDGSEQFWEDPIFGTMGRYQSGGKHHE